MLSILHVDSNFFYKEIIKDFSREKGVKYLTANNSKEAFQVLANNKIDLIVTAVELKNENGEQFLRALNESEYKDIPVIVLSARDDIETKNKLFRLGAIDFISKNILIDRIKYYINLEDFRNKQLKDIRIAVLDDNELELMIIRKIFEMNNITNVDYYTEPEELLNKKEEYSLYIIDFILPTMSGKQVISELRKKYKYAFIISISAMDNEKIISNILSVGADDYILKPFSENIFMARLKANVRTFLLLQELKGKNLQLKTMVNIDGLTSLYNHKYMYERLEEEIKSAKIYNNKLSLIMFDIDKFKLINDTYGHQTGDEVLIKIGNELKQQLRKSYVIGRYGGEEFILILPETDLKGAVILAERLRKGISEIKFKEENITVTISVGAAELKSETAIELIGKSDKLLYTAKRNGRDRIEY
ncbi:diguanylate cyclase [Clostridium ganghwense]|uniref:Stage 0 sporulation protein A homolog n=1 Tax=Clostridium ganghwense TaxID=312089 RepID=A0ABT4CPE1_9CLOT|nr:diguanylate cyclase [Clostridium ganghwense]MCY6370929.1 diguanylate cyclase [Clostridium ganghwense]